jgi:hypothetical protein
VADLQVLHGDHSHFHSSLVLRAVVGKHLIATANMAKLRMAGLLRATGPRDLEARGRRGRVLLVLATAANPATIGRVQEAQSSTYFPVLGVDV